MDNFSRIFIELSQPIIEGVTETLAMDGLPNTPSNRIDVFNDIKEIATGELEAGSLALTLVTSMFDWFIAQEHLNASVFTD